MTGCGYHNNGDVWVAKLDSSFPATNPTWQKCYGGSFGDYGGVEILQDSDGGYVFSAQTYSIDGDVVGNHGGGDAWIVKLSGSVTDPVFTPLNPAPSPTAIAFTITDTTVGATIHYTSDGSTPTCTSSPSGSSPINLTTPSASGTYVYKAIACETGWTASNVVTSTYVITGTVADPIFNPPSGYSSPTAIAVTITETTAGATIHYTTDGSTPTCTSSPSGSSPVNLTTPSAPGTYTYKAIACETNWLQSNVITSTYTITDGLVPDPTFTPSNPAPSLTPIAFTIDDSMSGAIIHYNNGDGSTPDCNTSPSGTGPINLVTPSAPGTYVYKAIACYPNYTPSNVVTSYYTIIQPGVLPAPTFDPPGGSSIVPISFVIQDAEDGVLIHYTDNGDDPTCTSGYVGSSPISLTTPNALGTYVYKAMACESGWTDSSITTATYYITPDGIAPPMSSNDIKLTVYPNPTHGFATIEGLDKMTDMTIVIASSNGQIMYDNLLYSNNASVDLSSYPDGLYIIKIYGKDKYTGNKVSKAERIIKQ